MPATPPGKFTAPLAVADSHRNSRSGNDLVPRIALLMAGKNPRQHLVAAEIAVCQGRRWLELNGWGLPVREHQADLDRFCQTCLGIAAAASYFSSRVFCLV